MKKIIILIMIVLIIVTATIPIGALGSPATEGSYILPPTQNTDSYTGSFKLMRSFASVSTVYVHSSAQTNSAVVDGANVSYYPAFMVSTPDIMVAPSSYGFGNISDYSSLGGYTNRYTVIPLSGSSQIINAPTVSTPQLAPSQPTGNALVYTYTYDDAIDTSMIQYGIVTGEWIDHSSTNNIITGYSIIQLGNSGYSVTVTGQLTYGRDNEEPKSVNIDRTYSLAAFKTFAFNPKTLLQSDVQIDFDYYYFSGCWTVVFGTTAQLKEYKAYDTLNLESVDFISGYNEYTDQIYSIDLYPIARISNKLSSSSSGTAPSGTLTVNSAGVHDVTNYQYIDVDIPDYTLSYNGDIENGTYHHSDEWYGVAIDVIINADNTFERNTSLFINQNGESNVGHYEFAYVNIPQTVIDDVNAFDWLFGAIEGVLNLEIAPSFSIGNILLFIAGFAIIVWILKIYLGG